MCTDAASTAYIIAAHRAVTVKEEMSLYFLKTEAVNCILYNRSLFYKCFKWNTDFFSFK